MSKLSRCACRLSLLKTLCTAAQCTVAQTCQHAWLCDWGRYIQSLIADEVKAGIPAKRVIVCGFSQGGVMALMSLREPVEVGGVLALSSYLPLASAPTVVAPENKDTKVLMCHGTADPVVRPAALAEI